MPGLPGGANLPYRKGRFDSIEISGRSLRLKLAEHRQFARLFFASLIHPAGWPLAVGGLFGRLADCRTKVEAKIPVPDVPRQRIAGLGLEPQVRNFKNSTSAPQIDQSRAV